MDQSHPIRRFPEELYSSWKKIAILSLSHKLIKLGIMLTYERTINTFPSIHLRNVDQQAQYTEKHYSMQYF